MVELFAFRAASAASEVTYGALDGMLSRAVRASWPKASRAFWLSVPSAWDAAVTARALARSRETSATVRAGLAERIFDQEASSPPSFFNWSAGPLMTAGDEAKAVPGVIFAPEAFDASSKVPGLSLTQIWALGEPPLIWLRVSESVAA